MQVTHEYAKDVLVVVKLLRSPARSFRSLAGQFLVF
jgi:two-component system CitB family sensor kinase